MDHLITIRIDLEFKMIKFIIVALLMAVGAVELTLACENQTICYRKECGIRPELNSKVFFGDLARESEFPWTVSLRENGNHFCGGSIIGERWIITAASCVTVFNSSDQSYHQKPLESLSVLIGSLNVTAEFLGANQKLLQLKRLVVYPHYDSQTKQDNLALIELAEPIDIQNASENINSICLGGHRQIYPGRYSVVSGWGSTEQKEISESLRKADLEIYDFEKCWAIYRAMNIANLNRDQLCASGVGNSCQGDIGGPLQCHYHGRWYLIGLVSFAPPNCQISQFPVVYTRIPNYNDFIHKITGI